MNEDNQCMRKGHRPQTLNSIRMVSSIISLFLVLHAVASAADRDIELAKSLIAAMKQPIAPERDRIEEILAQIPKESPHRPVAAQAVAMIYMQQGRLAEARKCLQSSPAQGEAMQLNERRLKLWSLLEEESTEGTEVIFKDIVRMAISKALPNNEQTLLIEQLGAVVGMLQTEENPKAIPTKTIEQAKIALETRVSKSHASRFLGQWEISNQRGMAIKAKIAEFQSLDVEEAKGRVRDLEAELENQNQSVTSIKERKEEERRIVDELEESRRAFFDEIKNLNNQLRIETPGRPKPPVPPTKPRQPNLNYVEDKATGRRVLDARSEREKDDYDRKMRDYHSNMNDFQNELQNFRVRQAAWEIEDQRRKAMLQSQKQQVGGAIVIKDKEISEAKKKMREGVFAELNDATSELSKLSEIVLVSKFALADKLDSSGKPKSSIRPSRFDLLDFTTEESRLLRALR